MVNFYPIYIYIKVTSIYKSDPYDRNFLNNKKLLRNENNSFMIKIIIYRKTKRSFEMDLGF